MKRTLAMLMILIMTLGLITGCAGGDPAEAPAPGESQIPAEALVLPENGENAQVDTVILYEADDSMLNTYTLIAVDPAAPFTDADGKAVSGVAVNTAGADALIKWLLSPQALDLAGSFGLDEYGENLFYVLETAPVYEGEIAAASDETKTIRLSTTTSVNDSGLLAMLLPVFEAEYGYEVEVQSAGTGKAIASAKYGNADLIFVHSKSQEQAFVDEGFARCVNGFDNERISFIYNYFVLCGPSADPAGAAACAGVKDAFAAIAQGEHTFISRGDGSGTHTKELSLWPESLAITAEPESFAEYTGWYNSANAGMGACLVMAEELGGYILTDKATFLAFAANNGQAA